MTMRIGNGYDMHRLVKGRALILGGVNIEWRLGLDGHSDADVLLHALCDALLGAAGLGDMGRYFPATEACYKDMASREFVRLIKPMLAQRNWRVQNIDCTIIAEKPRLAPYIPQMELHIATDLGIAPERVNVKATSTDQLGVCGQQKAMAAAVNVLLQQTDSEITTG